MFERFDTPEDIFSFKLGSALSMEHDTLDMLVTMQEKTPRADLQQLFHEHEEETRQQIRNLEQCFALLGEEVDDSPSPTTKGLAKEAQSTIGKTDASLVDAVLLAGGLEAEHYEMAVYEILIINAKARGADDVAQLLQQNYDQEVAAAEKIRDAAARISSDGIAAGASRDAGAARADAGTATIGTEKADNTGVLADDGLAHPFDQTNGLADGLDGDSDGSAESDTYSQAERASGRGDGAQADRGAVVPPIVNGPAQ